MYLVELYHTGIIILCVYYLVCLLWNTRKKENGSSRAGECRRVRGGASSDQRTHKPPDLGRWTPTPLSRVRRRAARLGVQVAHRRPPTLPHTLGVGGRAWPRPLRVNIIITSAPEKGWILTLDFYQSKPAAELGPYSWGTQQALNVQMRGTVFSCASPLYLTFIYAGHFVNVYFYITSFGTVCYL